jgi:beta-glucuronidase
MTDHSDLRSSMLAPRDTPTRERRSLDGLWRFTLDPDDVGRAEGWPGGLPAGAREMPVPASYNDVLDDAGVHTHVGLAWYETTTRVPAGWAGQRIVLRFSSATHAAVVWVDGRQVAEHRGGYTPFEADVTDLVVPGGEHRITVAVDNRLTWHTIPPGYIDETPDGPRQRLLFDFFNYAGLHRTVWLYTTPPAHVADVSVVTTLDGADGGVRYEVEAEGGLEVRVALTDAEGTEVARATGASGELAVPGVHPWRPGEGYLYDLAIELRDDGDAPVDVYSLPVGVRSVEVRGARFLINGEPFHFRGFGMHEDHPVRGKGHDAVHMVNDFALLLSLGANSFRTSHYPYAEEVLEYADRHGIVVIDETPAVGINSGLAAGAFGAEPFVTFSPETIGEATQEAHRQVLRELVARDRNHPCVVMWSIANEPESVTPEARAYFEPLAAETRALDPSRPIGFANVSGAEPDLDVVTDLFDVVMLNRYYGWYLNAGDLAAAERALEAELRAWAAAYDKPILITEYGADTIAGMHGVFPGPWTEEYQVALLEMSHRVFDRIDAVVGEQIWNFADFAVAPGILRAGGINRKGVFTRTREPKAAVEILRRRWGGA